mgnify:CR=1 FL=1
MLSEDMEEIDGRFGAAKFEKLGRLGRCSCFEATEMDSDVSSETS